eukprot:359447-Chlamydomonas_euryale.AAC.2
MLHSHRAAVAVTPGAARLAAACCLSRSSCAVFGRCAAGRCAPSAAAAAAGGSSIHAAGGSVRALPSPGLHRASVSAAAVGRGSASADAPDGEPVLLFHAASEHNQSVRVYEVGGGAVGLCGALHACTTTV